MVYTQVGRTFPDKSSYYICRKMSEPRSLDIFLVDIGNSRVDLDVSGNSQEDNFHNQLNLYYVDGDLNK